MLELIAILIMLLCVIGESIAHNHDVAKCEEIIEEQNNLLDEVIAENQRLRASNIMATANQYAEEE